MTANYPHGKRKSALRSKRSEQWLLIVLVVLLFTLLFALLLGLNMRRGLNHDEHQFVASAALLARDAALPYVDFAYFHVPLLSLAYAVIYGVDTSLLLSARLFSVYFAWLMLGLIFVAAYRRRVAARLRLRFAFAALAVGWMMAMPLFIYTSGRAWNHDLPIFLLLLAFFIQSDALVERRSSLWLGASGLLMGLALATRLSFALMAVPFVITLWLYPVYQGRQRLTASLTFAAGALIGAVPALVFLALDPAAFLFGNIEYIGLNTEYYRQAGTAEAMTLTGKLAMAAQLLLTEPSSLVAILVLIFTSVPLWGDLRQRMPFTRPHAVLHDKHASLFRYAFALLLLSFAAITAFAATPSQPQYFYLLFPLILLAIIYAVNAWPVHLQHRGILLFSAAALAAILLSVPAYLPGLAVVTEPNAWYPTKIHARGQQISRLVERGKVLTLSPIPVLEGGVEIYREFATGPFGWRVAPLVDPERRERFHLVAAEDLTRFLADDPPRAILTGLDNDDVQEEAPFIDYAQTRNYVPVSLLDEGVLWLAPMTAWNDQIQLGGHTLPRRALTAGETFVLTLYLQNIGAIEENLSVLVRLVDAQDNELVRSEGWPWGSPTSSWPLDEVWADGHTLSLPATTEPGYYALEVGFYDPAHLDAAQAPTVIGYVYVAAADSVPFSLDAAPLARLGDAIDLLAVDAPARARPGETLQMQLVWRAMAPLSADYTTFIHLLDEQGMLAAQMDSPPLGGFYPTRWWLPTQPVTDAISLPLPPELPAGTYRLVAGMYDPEDLLRLPVSTADGPAGDVIDLGTVVLE